MKIQILLITLLASVVYGLKVKDFQPSLFKFSSIEQGFRIIDTGSERMGQVMAFTDLDGDRQYQYCLLIIALIMQLQRREIPVSCCFTYGMNISNVLFYVTKNRVFAVQKKVAYNGRIVFIIDTINRVNHHMYLIDNNKIDDLNQNGQNQFVITAKDHKSLYKTLIFTTNCIQCENDLTTLMNSEINNMLTVPFLIDNQGNGKVRLVVFNSTGRYIYSYDFITNNFDIKPFTSVLNTNTTTFNPVQKHFASIIDLNNDCYADLTILSYKQINQQKIFQLQIYEKQSNNNYSLKNVINLQNTQKSQEKQFIDEILMLTWTDIDNTGSADLIIFYKSNDKFYLKTLTNTFVPSQLCKSSNGLFPYQDFDLTALPSLILPQQYALSQISIPRFNDLNADGLPDILVLMKLNGYAKVIILMNQGNLHFNKYEDQWKSYDINNPSQALFYDFGEDGKMDFMILSEERKTSNNVTTTSYTRTSIINNLQSDTLHLKILPLSISSIYNEDEKKIENTFGVTTQWLFTDIDGNKLVKISNQKVQFNYGTLLLPYAYSGLGRTNNYLEQLTVGYQNYGQRNDWSPIIPNSQLMVYKQQGVWKLQTLLKNDQRVNDVIYVSIMILLCMGTVIVYLGYREAQQDKRDHYNFIQLIR